jgi:hypothetical protein
VNRLRDPRWLLILTFLGIIGGVPLVQAILEVRREENIRALAVFSQAPTAENFRAYERSIENANWASQLTRPWVQFAQFAGFRDGGEKVVIGSDGWFFYKPGLIYMVARPERHQDPEKGTDPAAAVFHFRDQLAARGIQLLVVPVPNKESIYPDRLSPGTAAEPGLLAPRTREFMDKLRAGDVEVVDLFAEFTRARNEPERETNEPLYLAQDTHWSPAGVEVAAEAVARRLLNKGWARKGDARYAERNAPTERLGDIVRMLQSPPIEARTPAELTRCVQVVEEDGAPYRDRAEAEILVIGDSFMRIYQSDAPGSAGFVAHRAKELRQPLMTLVNDGGGSTLVRRELRASPAFLKNKKVVIWEFVERDIGLGVEGWELVSIPPAP